MQLVVPPAVEHAGGRTKTNSADDKHIEEAMTCGVCQEILYKCVCG
jgi:hypothetical protein